MKKQKNQLTNYIKRKLEYLRENTEEADRDKLLIFIVTLALVFGYIGLIGWMFWLKGVV